MRVDWGTGLKSPKKLEEGFKLGPRTRRLQGRGMTLRRERPRKRSRGSLANP